MSAAAPTDSTLSLPIAPSAASTGATAGAAADPTPRFSANATPAASRASWSSVSVTTAAATNASTAEGLLHARPLPRYYRLTIEGSPDDDGDFVKSAELIASVLDARLSYKHSDKGQAESPVTLEEIHALGTVPPSQPGDRTGSTVAAATPAVATVAPAPTPTTNGTAPADAPSQGGGEVPRGNAALMQLNFDEGVFRVQGMRTELVPWSRYVSDIQRLYQAIESGPCLSTARSRLTALASRFQLFSLMNAGLEASSGQASGGGGVYVSSTKVDNGLHMKTSVPAPVLLEFITRTARERPNTPLFDFAEGAAVLTAAGLDAAEAAWRHRENLVRATGSGRCGSAATNANDNGNLNVSGGGGGAVIGLGRGVSTIGKSCMSLRQYLQAGGITDASVLTVEGLGLHPTLYRNKFLMYDVFSSQLNPCGAYGAKLLQAVLSTDSEGPNRGDLCGSLIRAEMERREFKPRQAVVTEMLLDVSGINEFEVASLAAWTRHQGFNSFATNMWILNIVPRFKRGFDREGGAASAETATAATAATGARAAGASGTRSASSQVSPSPPPPQPPMGSSTTTPTCRTVGQQLRNIFYPLFMATLYPSVPRWSDVAQLLMNTGAISLQTDATSRTQNLFTKPVHPDSIRIDLSDPRAKASGGAASVSGATQGPSSSFSAAAAKGHGNGKEAADFYYFYYIWANVASLNSLRARFGLNTLKFNPSVQEQAPAYDQLACSFLLGDNVYHATSLHKCWIMQYLYMYARVGLVMSPLRDNALSISFFDHPIARYFQQGLQVSLSTSDPLHFHHRIDSPLLEEYSSLLKLRSLSAMDLCELARNSVLNSNFPEHVKRKWLGDHYTPVGCLGNDVRRSNVCDPRLQFRAESLAQEEAALNRILAKLHETKAKPGSGPAKVVSIIAEASSPLFFLGHHLPPGAAAAALAGTGMGRRLPLAAAAASRFSVAPGSRTSRTSRSTRRAHRSHQEPPPILDTRVSYPRIRISYDTGLEDGGSGSDGSDAMNGEETDTAAIAAPVDVHGAAARRTSYAAASALQQVLLLRRKYATMRAADVNVEDVFDPARQLDEDRWEYNSYYGVVLLSRAGKSATWPASIPPLRDFIRDVATVRQAASSVALRRLAAHRLSLLERKFQLHLSVNIGKEAGPREEKEWNNRDFFTAHKVDTNVQVEAGHNAHTLLEFFLDKAVNHGDDVVGEDDEQNPVTLRMLLQHYAVRVETVTVDELFHLLATHEDLHSTFLSPHNYMQGRYFAELTKRTLSLYQEDAYSFAENRITLHGRTITEWQQLSQWFDRYGMASSQSRWLITVPREYAKLRANGAVMNFGDFLDNIFLPLWEISLHPAKDTKLHYFLTHVSGFDCVKKEEPTVNAPLLAVHPHDWREAVDPPYNYYMYYLWANITSLNEFRASRDLSTLSFRPQCGERGGLGNLIGGYLLASGINHGVTLARHPVLEYLFYLAQIGIAMSPLSNTAVAAAYLENPFPTYFQRGLNVSLATNTPLYFHFTREPLIEEYSLAAKLWQLEFNDLSEIARNSVLQCGFPPAWKARALGRLYTLRSTLGNDVRRSRVSDIRVAFRYECYHSEIAFLNEQLRQPCSAAAAAMGTADGKLPNGDGADGAAAAAARVGARSQQLMPSAMRTLAEEVAVYRSVVGVAPADAPGSRAGAAGGGAGARRTLPGGIPGPATLARLMATGARDALDEMDSDSSATDTDGGDAISGGGGGDAAATPRLVRRRRRECQQELSRLEREWNQLTSLTEQLHAENGAVATMIEQLRERLGSEGLTIRGGLLSTKR